MSQFALPIAELKPALTGLGKVLNRQTRLPVLSMIKLERTQEGWITLATSDREHFISVRLEQRSEGKPGALLVPYGELLAVTKSCGRDEQILIERDSPSLVSIRYSIGSQYAEYKVETCPAEEFPDVPRIDTEPIPLPDPLRASIQQALECASADATRLVLNGAYLDVSQSECHQVVATDGRHLFSSNSFALPLRRSLILPTHRFLQWREFSWDGEWQLRVAPGAEKDGPAHIQISSRRWRFITSEAGGNYPNWRQVVPSTSEMKCSFELEPRSVEQVLQAIQRLPCHDPLNFSVGLEVTANKVHLLGKTGVGEQWIRIPLPVGKITGRPLTTFLNRHYLTKALRFGLTRVELIDPMSPVRFSQGGRQMIIMPIRAEAVPPPPLASTDAQPEPPASGEENREDLQAKKPAASPPGAAPPERSRSSRQRSQGARMPRTAPAESVNTGAKIDGALHVIDSLRESLQRGLSGLRELSGKLKLIQREQGSVRSNSPERQRLPSSRRESKP